MTTIGLKVIETRFMKFPHYKYIPIFFFRGNIFQKLLNIMSKVKEQ